MKVFLVGMPGSGKSTIGKILSETLDWKFLDLDEIIIQQEKSTITDIFKTKGESFFRELEHKVLSDMVALDESFVLATGGGTPCFHDSMDLMNKNGLTVFLDTSLETIYSRISSAEHRPLLRGRDPETSLQELFEKRKGYYRQAKITHDENTPIDVLIEEIKK